MIDTNVQIIEDLQFFLLEANNNKTQYTTYRGAFTKPKKLSFEVVVLFLLSNQKKSLGIEIENYFKEIEKEKSMPTKSAISQARYKLKKELFIDWNDALQDSFYFRNKGGLKKWKNYILQGVDGSTLQLMNQEEIIEEFGCHGNQHSQTPMARTMIRYDLLNEIIVSGQIASIKKSEDALSLLDLDKVSENVISIYDRNFISFTFLYEHERRGLDYIMRSRVGFNKEIKQFVASQKESEIVKIYPRSKAIRQLRERGISLPTDLKTFYIEVRLVRVELSTGEIEVLVSSLMDQEVFPQEDFKVLYNLRWGVETCYDILKNKLQITAFTGHKPEAIKQDFYITLFLANLNSILIKSCEQGVEQKTKDREYSYKVNRNISIGLMKNDIAKLFIVNKENVIALLNNLKDSFLRHLEPIRPGRSFIRSKKKKAIGTKYVTLTNYRRAM